MAVRGIVAIVLAACVVATFAPATGHGASREGTAARITVALSGDDLATSVTWPVAKRNAGGHGYDFRPMLARLRPLLGSVDLAICHLETPLAGPGVPRSDYPRFAVPPQLSDAILSAGYRGCSTASNHSFDHGAPGIRTTLDRLDAVGLAHTGTARTQAERGHTTMYAVGDVRIAHLSFTAPLDAPMPSDPWRVNHIATKRILADARTAHDRGADLVIVSLHWGEQFHHAPTSYQRAVADRLLRGDAIDLVAGHHAHVVQPIRRVHGHWVAYGMGNSFSGMLDEETGAHVQDGLVLLATFEEGASGWHVVRIRYAPTWVVPSTWVVRLVGPSIDGGGLPAWMLGELRRSWRRTVRAVDAKDLGVLPLRGATA
jgi:poly-gamma-glutamate synthesis protein (capsule biosynthesis protein)